MKNTIYKYLSATLLLSTVISLGSCQNKTDIDSIISNQNNTITITDTLGETITVGKNPSKVACVSRTTYDLLIGFGLGDKVDGAYKTIYDNPWTEFIYPQSKSEYRYEYNESYETFISRGIDLVFAPEKYIADGLKEHDIKAINVSLYGKPTFDNYVFAFADIVKKLWDSEEVTRKVDIWKNSVSKAIDDVKSELDKHNLPQKKIMYVRGDKNKGIGYTDNLGSFTEYAFRILGFDFAGSHFESNRPSQEDICKYNPDVFVIGGIFQNTLVETLKNDPIYAELDSVKNNKIYTIPVGLTMFEQLSVMTPVFFYDMANKIYPEYFSYDIASMVKDTIKNYFGTILSDNQISYMLNGKDYNGNNLA